MTRAARAYRDDWPDYGPPNEPITDLPLFAPSQGEAARDQVIAAFDAHKPTIVQALRDEAHRLYAELGRPISANDLRPLLQRVGYDGDHRILIAAFKGWTVVGMTTTNAKGNHARKICLFTPRKDAT